MYLWYNLSDNPYGLSHWVAANSSGECEKVLAETYEVSIAAVAEKRFYWQRSSVESGVPRYLGYSGYSPKLIRESDWRETGF